MLEVRGAWRSFGSTQALVGASLTVRLGSVHALLGVNGAGKSTLLRVLAGVDHLDRGSVMWNGSLHVPSDVRDAEARGVTMVHQEVRLVATMSVDDNLLLGRFPMTARGTIDRRAARADASRALARVGLNLRGDEAIEDLPLSVRQRVAIARALEAPIGGDTPRLLILDEPTSSLTGGEVRVLFDLMRQVASEGAAILFVGHSLREVEEIATEVTVLRNGATVLTGLVGASSRRDWIDAMLGPTWATPATTCHSQPPAARGERLLVDGIASEGGGVTSAAVAQGESVGLAGLLGAGRSELLRVIAGIAPSSGITVSVDGARIPSFDVHAAQRAGIGFLPEDRHAEGLCGDLSVRENLLLAAQSREGWWSRLPEAHATITLQRLMEHTGIPLAAIEQPVKTLSGGNQQKVLLVRLLLLNPKVLLLDEPHRGVDVGAVEIIDGLIAEQQASGVSVVRTDPDIEALCAVCDRIAVLVDGSVVGPIEALDALAVRKRMSGVDP